MKAQVIGRLAKDAEIKTIGGKNYAAFCIPEKDRNDNTTWVNILYRENGLFKWLRKGCAVVVTGRLTASTYAAKDGTTKMDLTIWANEVEMAAFAPDQETAESLPAPHSANVPADNMPVNGNDDLPF